jgi:murein DD-endopeptidase MepM/ murein hydrolase activator NlpD
MLASKRFVKPMVALLVAIFFVSFTIPLNQKPLRDYPIGFFQMPVKHKMELSATFGELRPNHFHAGIDIRPSRTGAAGDPIIAAAEGWIARIKISAGGYGNAIYIGHPNGYTTVYGHLHNFPPEIDSLIKAKHYERQTYELDWSLGENEYPIQRAQTIGFMGNTGGSQGVHLHFEIRESATDEAINPLLFGLTVNDRVAPAINQLKVYLFDANSKAMQTNSVTTTLKAGQYHVPKDTVFVAATRVGLAIKTFDGTGVGNGQDGVYKITLLVNGSPVHRFTAERFSFDETKYINAHMDYEMATGQKSNINKSFRMPGNQLKDMYSEVVNDGYIDVSAEQASEITYLVEDYFGNLATLQFKLAYRPGEITIRDKPYQYVLPFNEASAITQDNFRLFVDQGCLYETLEMQYNTAEDRSNNVYSSVHHVHNTRTPIHKPMEIGIKPTRQIPAELRDKAFVALCGSEQDFNYGGVWEGDYLKAKIEQFGNFCIELDTIAPTIKTVAFAANMTGSPRMRFAISDNMPTKGRATEGLSYNGYIDGNWVLFEHDGKNKTISYDFDERIGHGSHTLRLEVSDNRDNMRVIEQPFIW